jgi:hypothetical protein
LTLLPLSLKSSCLLQIHIYPIPDGARRTSNTQYVAKKTLLINIVSGGKRKTTNNADADLQQSMRAPAPQPCDLNQRVHPQYSNTQVNKPEAISAR